MPEHRNLKLEDYVMVQINGSIEGTTFSTANIQLYYMIRFILSPLIGTNSNTKYHFQPQ